MPIPGNRWDIGKTLTGILDPSRFRSAPLAILLCMEYGSQNENSENKDDGQQKTLLHKEVNQFFERFPCADDRRLSQLNIEKILPDFSQGNHQLIKFHEIIGFEKS